MCVVVVAVGVVVVAAPPSLSDGGAPRRRARTRLRCGLNRPRLKLFRDTQVFPIDAHTPEGRPFKRHSPRCTNTGEGCVVGLGEMARGQ